jgi:hypothetical protein
MILKITTTITLKCIKLFFFVIKKYFIFCAVITVISNVAQMHCRLQHANSIQVSLVSIYPEMAPMSQIASAGFSWSSSGSEFLSPNFLALEVHKLPY